jgi:hypothetical protein
MKIYTPASVPSGRGSKGPYISINPKTGRIGIYGPAMERLKASKSDKLAFCQDEKRPQDWYIAVHPDGFPLIDKKGVYDIISRPMARTILDSLGITEHSKFLVGEFTDENGCAIITKSAKP